MSDANIYDEKYFLHGKEYGLSLYEDYRWLEELTIPMCKAIVAHLHLKSNDYILDFGCARGYVVKAFHMLGYKYTSGVDLSRWAIDNCDLAVKDYVTKIEPTEEYDIPDLENHHWVIAKDVLEHVQGVETVIDNFQRHAITGIFAVVPLAYIDNDEYVVPDYEKDITHIHRLSLPTWAKMFMKPGWAVQRMYRLPGVKDNYAAWVRGNGFITARRLEKQ
jgi:Methyltransferase domain